MRASGLGYVVVFLFVLCCMPTHRVRAGEDSGRILQYEFTEMAGNRTTYRLTKTEEDPDLDEALFRFKPPSGVPVVEVGAP